ncbi:MAG: DUF3303 family protein [Gammaproteobacteria bacterium]|nr:DUF3303 family protein [Gammaproteobacteria bacterium]
MLYMLINVTKPGLTGEQYATVAQLANAFYENVPEGIKLHGDWSANDRSRTFSLIEADSPDLLEVIQRPFQGLVDIETVPVTAVTRWRSE